MKKIITFAILALTAVGFSACNDDLGGNSKTANIKLSASEMEVNKVSNDFAYKLMKTVSDNENDKNVVLSPLSMQMALSMLANGADGNTLQEIINAMGFEGQDISAVNSYNKTVMHAMKNADKKVEIYNANGIWLNGNFSFNDAFTSECSSAYDAEVSVIKEDKVGDIINDWASKKTNGMINKIIDDDGTPWIAYLANALYFKATWADGNAFDKAKTADKEFKNYDGSTSKVKFMSSELKSIGGFSNDVYSSYSLPYGNGSFSFVIVVPSTRSLSLDNTIEYIAQNGLPEAKMFNTQKETEFSMPKLDFNEKTDLRTVCNALGINDVFYEKTCNLSKMTTGSVWMDKINQNCILTVDESGTVAAATTQGEIVLDAGRFPVCINSPFLFFIRENSTGAILLMGKIMKM